MGNHWKTGAGAIVGAAAIAIAAVSAAPAHAEPVVQVKDLTKPAVVILGYGLNGDGSMQPILQRRVLTGYSVANFFPWSQIIVTGGNPQNGVTEAAQMRKMLLSMGIPSNRIIVEDRARSTVENARYSVPLARQAGASGIILVTSSTHQGRADGNFVDAGANLLATVSYPDGDLSTNIAQFARDAMSPFLSLG